MTRNVALLILIWLLNSWIVLQAQPNAGEMVIENGRFDSNKGWFHHVVGNGKIEIVTGQLIVSGPNKDDEDTNPSATPATVYAYQDIQVTKTGTLTFKLLSYASVGDSGSNDYPVFILDKEILKLYSNGFVENYGGAGRPIDNDLATGNTITYMINLKPGKYRIGLGVHTIDGYYGSGVAVFDDVAFYPEKK
ncbi:MAG: hypothetical protein RMJ87_05925 [Cytophagales bacterium]|nr:hypothetical protein [Bernardetiaceae bacterium]MDW8204547.1 hypothetical protein [Cytophagales bacterium]